MRWIFLCLVSFNLIYFSWKFFAQEAPVLERDAVIVSDQASDNSLVLLKEVLPGEGSAAPPPSIDFSKRFVKVEPVEAKLAVEGEVSKPSEVKKPSVQDEIVEEVLVAEDSVVIDQASEDVVVAEVEPEAGSEPEENFNLAKVEGAVGPLVVESEVPEVFEKEVEVVEEPPGPVLERVCAKIGPYSNEDRLAGLLDSLGEKLLSSTRNEENVVVSADNWVLIPSLGSRKEALKMLKVLQANKIDSYLVTEGEHSNTISLGLFKRASSAQGVLDKMRSAGYEAEVHVLERVEPRYWATILGEFEAGSAEQMLSQLVEDREKIKISETLCEMFASTP